MPGSIHTHGLSPHIQPVHTHELSLAEGEAGSTLRSRLSSLRATKRGQRGSPRMQRSLLCTQRMVPGDFTPSFTREGRHSEGREAWSQPRQGRGHRPAGTMCTWLLPERPTGSLWKVLGRARTKPHLPLYWDGPGHVAANKAGSGGTGQGQRAQVAKSPQQ